MAAGPSHSPSGGGVPPIRASSIPTKLTSRPAAGQAAASDWASAPPNDQPSSRTGPVGASSAIRVGVLGGQLGHGGGQVGVPAQPG